jgi:hypothetical protein
VCHMRLQQCIMCVMIGNENCIQFDQVKSLLDELANVAPSARAHH